MFSNYDPDLYDVFFEDSFAGDVEWYRQLAIESGGPVLELGAGTGRIVIPIARAGIAIHALDADTGMLERLREKLLREPTPTCDLVTIGRGDMRSFDLTESFAMIQIPFRTFLNNLTREDQLACLRCCHAHLRDEGVLAINVFHPSLEYMSQNSGALEGVWRLREERSHPAGGKILLSDCNQYDTINQRVSSRLRYEHFDDSGELLHVHLQSLELVYLYPGDIRGLLDEAGFGSVRIDGDYQGQAPAHDGCELVVQARRG